MISSTFLFALLLSSTSFLSVEAGSHHARVSRRNHNLLNRHLDHSLDARQVTNGSQPVRRRRCKNRPPQNNEPSPTSSTPSATKPPQNVAPTPPKSGGGGGGGGGGSGKGKPANWPTATQAGAAPASFLASPADPLLLELSKSYDNTKNPLYLKEHVGEMTYYGQGLGACGDTYNDQSFTAAVSQLLYDQWPGASNEKNRNPICGPFVPGRKVIGNDGLFKTAPNGRGDGKNFALMGGDGKINCDAQTQCHIPLTATVTHGSKSIIVQIVDRCEGCAVGDIDLTPAAFAALADPALGRTDVKWKFNQY